MNKLPLLSITLLMSISGFSMAADEPTILLLPDMEEKRESVKATRLLPIPH